jgi:hypothetical protein
VTIAVEVPDSDATPVIVQVDLEFLALFLGQKGHAECNARLPGALQKSTVRRKSRVFPQGSVQNETGHTQGEEQGTHNQAGPGNRAFPQP